MLVCLGVTLFGCLYCLAHFFGWGVLLHFIFSP